MPKEHHYAATTTWVGHDPQAAFTYRSYSRAHRFEVDGKPALELTADPSFRGDAATLNPEDCLLAALSSCHMLSYLALAALRKVAIVAYADRVSGVMVQEGAGGRFTQVTLRPTVTLRKASDRDVALELHHKASQSCFIASSVNFPVHHEAVVVVLDEGG